MILYSHNTAQHHAILFGTAVAQSSHGAVQLCHVWKKTQVLQGD